MRWNLKHRKKKQNSTIPQKIEIWKRESTNSNGSKFASLSNPDQRTRRKNPNFTEKTLQNKHRDQKNRNVTVVSAAVGRHLRARNARSGREPKEQARNRKSHDRSTDGGASTWRVLIGRRRVRAREAGRRSMSTERPLGFLVKGVQDGVTYLPFELLNMGPAFLFQNSHSPCG